MSCPYIFDDFWTLLAFTICLPVFLPLSHCLDYCSSLAFLKFNHIIKVIHVHNSLRTQEVLDLILSWIFNLYFYFLFPRVFFFFFIACKCSYFRIAISYLRESSVGFVLFSLEVFSPYIVSDFPFSPFLFLSVRLLLEVFFKWLEIRAVHSYSRVRQ